MRMSLRSKLVATSLGMVLLPVVGIGGIGLYQFRSFAQGTCEESFQRLHEDAVETLTKGVQADSAVLQTFLERVEGDLRTLANAATLRTFLQARQGRSELFNDLGRQEVFRVVSGIEAGCATQHEMVQKLLESDLVLLGAAMEQLGPVRLGPEQQQWPAGTSSPAQTLPVLAIGSQTFSPDGSGSPRVLQAALNPPGRICAVFQKINHAGDMICVGGHAGAGAELPPHGTLLSNAPDAAGTLLQAIVDGKPSTGRCCLVGRWYTSVAVPLLTEDRQIAGLILVGAADTSVEALHKHILTTQIGKDGYVFVMDSRGTLLVHPNQELVGKNTVDDLKLTVFKEILEKRKPGELQLLNYEFESRDKFLVYTHFADWDWIICASGYWDDLSSMAAQASMQLLQAEVQAFWKEATMQVSQQPQQLYSQVRLLDAAGREVYNLQNGQFARELGERSQVDWFRGTLELEPGQVYHSGVVISVNTRQEEMRVSTPVFVDGRLEGVVALNVGWTVPHRALRSRVYGKTGYCFLVDDKGILASHPTYRFTEQVNLLDPKFGRLAEITRDQMIAGKTGCVSYEFDGIEKFVAFAPIPFGNRMYSIAAGVPEEEVLELARHIQSQAGVMTRSITWLLLISATVLTVLGSLVGWRLSHGIASPIQRIVAGLNDGARQVDEASSQVSSAAQQLAVGASEQASSLEETSSALEQMAAMTRNNASNADQADTMMEQTRQTVREGNQAMSQATQAMGEIAEASERISKIIKAIEEIAFQTNLLALNAAVEAARAGDHGKGFAVVADEVRNLAQRAAQAAKETGDLIAQTVDKVNRGVDLNKLTSESFARIGQASEQVAGLVAMIAKASNEQAQGVEQLNGGVSQMDKITQQNASSAEESAAASQELAAQARTVQQLVQQLSGLITGQPVEARAEMPAGTARSRQ